MAELLDGRVALVTGGSRGIGKGIAAACLRAGARVMISSRKQETLDQAVAELSKLVDDGDRVAAFAANAGDPEAAAACVAATMERFGAVDVLVNNAATNPYYGKLMNIDVGRMDKTVAVNQTAPLVWTQQAWHAWMAEHGGAVVNIASIGAFMVEHGFAYYNVTKAALVHLTRHLAFELSPTVRVNAIAPGFVKTDLNRLVWEQGEDAVADRIPLHRIGDVDDIGRAAVFLASDAGKFITGQVMVIDGGTMVQPGSLMPDMTRG